MGQGDQMASCLQGVCTLTQIRTQGTRRQVMLGLSVTLRSGEEIHEMTKKNIRKTNQECGMWDQHVPQCCSFLLINFLCFLKAPQYIMFSQIKRLLKSQETVIAISEITHRLVLTVKAHK